MGALTTKEVPSARAGSGDPRRALVQRIVGSAAFAKSERLSSFLVCICDLTLAGRANEINEQKIGTAVFGRPVDYDSTIDGIVRPQASRLRQRLDLYFSGEGADEPIRITLPRGSYVPLFEPHKRPSQTLQEPDPVTEGLTAPAESEPLERRTRSVQRGWIALTAILAIALFAMALKTFSSSTKRSVSSPTSHPLWAMIFRSDQQTLVVPSDTGLVLWRGVTKKSVELPEYLRGDYRERAPQETPKAGLDVADLGSRRYTSIVDLDIVKDLQHVADSQNGKFEVRYARDVRPNDLKSGNVVLIGAAAANPWVELFEPKMNFVFSDAHFRQYTVVNRSPVGSEPAKWSADYDDPQKRVYGVVAFLPNLSGTGNVLILEGTSMSGTECAWDFVSEDSSLLPFLRKIRRADGTLPHFQLVLDSVNLGDSSVKRTILAWRVTD